jgi:hypothetical protein
MGARNARTGAGRILLAPVGVTLARGLPGTATSPRRDRRGLARCRG